MSYGSKYFFEQRKRRREEDINDQYPLRLVGGAGRGRGAPRGRGGGAGGRGRGRGRGRGGGGGGLAPFLVPLHALWNQAAAPVNMHFDVGTIAEIPVDDGTNPRIIQWVPPDNPPIAPRWGWQLATDDYFPQAGAYPISAVRAHEINRLAQCGITLDRTLDLDNGGDGYVVPPYHEPKWAFGGMAQTSAFGPAWSCFYYVLGDLWAGGYGALSDICSALMQICEDIVNIGAGAIDGNLRAAFFFEGLTDFQSAERVRLCITDFALSLNSVMNNPSLILDRMMLYLTSNATFLFHRVYVNVLIPGGGSLKNMPQKIRDLREGPFYQGVKGFNLIDDKDDGSCGLDAIIYAYANALRNITKMCRQAQKTVPELCRKFENYRKNICKVVKNNKAQLLHANTKAELASYIGWKKGTDITPEEICTAVTEFSKNNLLDVGVVIFDALKPLSEPITNYDPTKTIPQEKLCLVYWKFSSLNGDVPGGHYDCINPSNVTSWLQKFSGNKRKDLKYSWRCFKLLTNAQADDKGMICEFCKHWQLDTPNDRWMHAHGGNQRDNKVLCGDCNVKFKSDECYQKHIVKATSQSIEACRSARLCVECKRVHTIYYDCTKFFCKMCSESFPKKEEKTHVCYLKYISEKKCSRLRKVIYADTEGSRQVGWHECICIAAGWSEPCDTHMQILMRQKPQCKNCWWNSDNWGWFCNECIHDNELECDNDCKDCQRIHTKYFEGATSLSEFMDWVMTEKTGSTVVFHNGGRYDLQMLVMEIMTSGKYTLSNDAMRGTQIIYFTANHIVDDGKRKKSTQVRFIDSFNFIQAPLRNFPVMFNFEETEKGVFPYELVNIDPNWRAWNGKCPPIHYFGVTEKEAKNPDLLPKNRQAAVKHIMAYIKEQNRLYDEEKKTWNALEKLEAYTINDVIVLYKGCEIFRRNFWELVGMDPFQCVSLASAIAASYRQPEFMIPNSIQIFPNEEREFQRQALRGGRCEPFKLFWKAETKSQSMYWYDINSEYPYVQAYGFYPFGAMSLELKYKKMELYSKVNKEFKNKMGISLSDVLKDASGKSGCGIIECEIQSGDNFVPILPAKIKTTQYVKNVFQNRTGYWIGFISVLAMAVTHDQVIVRGVKRIQYWKNTTDKLFKKFICRLYAAKVEASGWSKILNKPESEITDDEKAEYIKESKRRGVDINPDNVRDNPGMRATAKIMCNCGWGYLCQKPHGNENHFFDNYDDSQVSDMADLIEKIGKGEYPGTIVGAPTAVGKYTRIRTNKKPEDMTVDDLNKKIAYQVGGEVPAKGLQVLTSGLTYLDPSQIVYCDTDSIGYVYDETNPKHKHLPSGHYLGDWVNEYPGQRITQFVSLGCKTYYLEIEDMKTGKMSYKGRFKGIPLGSASFTPLDEKGEFAKLGFKEMKDMLFASLRSRANEFETSIEDPVDELVYKIKYTNWFKRNPDYKITTREEKKTVKFTFDKREIIIPPEFVSDNPEDLEKVTEVNTVPLRDLSTTLTQDEIRRYWECEFIK